MPRRIDISLKPIEVKFGDVFVADNSENALQYVITALHPEGNFCYGNNFQIQEGQELIGMPGTIYRYHISLIIAKLNFEQIVKGLKNGPFQSLSPIQFENVVLRELREHASKPPMLLRYK